MHQRALVSLVCFVATLVAAAVPLGAQVTSSVAKGFTGEWTLSMDFNGQELEMQLEIRDASGKLAGSISSARSAEPQAIEDFDLEDGELTLGWSQEAQGQNMAMTMVLRIADGGGLSGRLADEGGFFSADLVAWKGDDAAPAAPRTSVRRRRRAGKSTELVVADQKIRISFADLEKDSDDYRRMEALAPGEVFSFLSGRSTKLLTDASLRFGDVLVERGNVHANYPGVYSLWLKRTADGWSLVLNSDGDIWGTQRLAEADVSEIALHSSPTDEEVPAFTVELLEADDGGLLRLAWGEYQWTALFEVVD